MQFTLGFSPCPNDTFIFDALVNKKIDTEGIDFSYMLEDVETLNEWALQGKLDITKLSFNAFFKAMDQYLLLNAGSALGKGCGPLLIAKKPILLQNIHECLIAIPGIHTTANLLLNFAFPQAVKRMPVLFSEIENSVLSGRADAGVIIHENRFTYHEKGLIKLQDLGEYWEEKTHCPIPLGGIAIKRNIDQAIQRKINTLIRKSVAYSFEQYPVLSSFITNNAQEMEEGVMRSHIDLYVNNYTTELGKDGKHAIEILMQEAMRDQKLNVAPTAIFLENI